MVARVLALLAAVAMVAGALVVRSRLDESDERTSTTLRLVCATELAAVCDALAEQGGSNVETTVESAARTADTLTKLAPGKRPPMDGWLVTAPWPEIVNELRAGISDLPIVTSGPILGRSPVVLAVQAGRLESLKAHCKAQPGWKCVGDVAGKPWTDLPMGQANWGRVRPGHPPVSTAAGLPIMGAATGDFFGSTDLSSTDLDSDGFRNWLARIEDAVPDPTSSPVQTMPLRPTFDVAGALEAEAGPLLAQSAGSNKPLLLYPSSVVTADVVLARADGRAGDLLEDLASGTTMKDELIKAGWRVAGRKPIAGIRESIVLPATSNLPNSGFLQALRLRVEQAAR